MLREMGFNDEALNRNVLAVCSNDTQAAVAALCAMGTEEAAQSHTS